MPALDLSIHADVGREHVEFLREHLLLAAEHIDPRPDSLSLAIVDDAAMADLHERYLNLPGPTDVLTFELDHDEAGRVTEGEVVICLGEAVRQSAEHGHEVRLELLLYALHGLLHLSGYDDTTDTAYATMHAKEDEVLEAMGLGRVFDRAKP